MDRKERARELRKAGKSLNEIVRIVGASKGSVSVWVRDIPQPEKFTKEFRHKQKLERLEKLKREREKNKGGRKERVISGDGRWMVPVPPGYKGKTYINGFYIYEHRLKMEIRLGRLLRAGEVVHHKDEDRLNNEDDNLILKTNRTHPLLHNKPKGVIQLKCSFCGKFFLKELRNYKVGLKKGTKKIYCNKSCYAESQKNTGV